ncbi:MAG: helix-turn-helix transcriptional regulator [Haliea sp.]|nr:helix-turn-helix transcriptional regulator [Haliea sp.]
MKARAMKDKAGRQLGNRAQKTRQRFLDATAKLLAERSILEISVTEIAREVDTASSLFYHYFKVSRMRRANWRASHRRKCRI